MLTPENPENPNKQNLNKNELIREATEKFSLKQLDLKKEKFYNYAINKSNKNKVFENFKIFIRGNSRYSSIMEDDKDKLKFEENLEFYITRFGVGLELGRKNLIKNIKNHYNIERSNESFLEGKIKNLSLIKINQILKNPKELDSFLDEIYEKNKKPVINKLHELIEKNFSFGYISLTERQKKLFSDIININVDILPLDMEELLETLDSKNKITLVQLFFSTINLKQLFLWGIIDKEKIFNILSIESKEIFEKHNINSENFTEKIGDIENTINLEDIYVSTLDIGNNEEILNKILKRDNLSNLRKILNDSKQEIRNKREEEGPQNLEGLIKTLTNGEYQKVKNPEKFGKDCFLKVSKSDSVGNKKHSWLKILDVDIDGYPKLSIKHVGEEDNITTDYIGDPDIKSYLDILKSLKKQSNSFEIFSLDEIINKGKDPSNNLKISSNPFMHKNELGLKEEIDGLNNALIDKRASLESEGKTTEEIENDESFKELVKKIEEKQNNFDNFSQINFNKLVETIDFEDNEGKELGLKPGIIIETKNWSYLIKYIDKENKTITLSSSVGQETIDYFIFLECFKKNKSKRKEEIRDFSSLLGLFQEQGNEEWKGYIFENNSLIKKNTYDNEKNEKLEYLRSKSGEVLKIKSINGNNLTIQLGTIKSDESDEGDEKIYIKGAPSYNITLNEFKNYIEKEGLNPDLKIGKKEKEKKSEKKQNTFLNNFASKLFRKVSIAEILQGGKTILDSLEETLKKGNEIHQAKIALAIGKYLPDEIESELRIKVEAAEGEQMDKALESLKKVDSSIASARILKWLKNKDCPEYKKEAGLLFMVQEYGVLTAKKLYEYKGKFLWYEAFGGKIGDDLYEFEKKQCIESSIPFSEEKLIYSLLTKQCGKGGKEFNNGFAGHKRRSRLYKELEGKWKEGVGKDFDKGYDDASKKRTAKDMVKGGLDEIKGGTLPNGMGWAKKTMERGGSMEDMGKIFFTVLFSGALNNTDQNILIKIKDLWDGDGIPMIMARFCSNQSEINLFNNVIVDLCKIAERSYPQFKGIENEAKNIFNLAKNGEGEEKSRIEMTINFWEKYGDMLSNALNMSNTSDTKYSYTNKAIILGKDENPNFRNYFNNVQIYSNILGFKEEYMTDGFKDKGVTGLSHYEVVRKILRMEQGGGCKNIKTGPLVWEEISNDIKSVPKKIFVGNSLDSPENRKAQRKYLLYVFREMVGAMLETHGGRNDALESYNLPATNIGSDLNSWNLYIARDLKSYSPKSVRDGIEEADNIFNGVINNIISGNAQGNISNITYGAPVDEILG